MSKPLDTALGGGSAGPVSPPRADVPARGGVGGPLKRHPHHHGHGHAHGHEGHVGGGDDGKAHGGGGGAGRDSPVEMTGDKVPLPSHHLDSLNDARREVLRSHYGARSPPSPIEYSTESMK